MDGHSAAAFAVPGTIALPLAWRNAPAIWEGMVHRDAWTVITAATGCGPVAIRAIWRRHYRLARFLAGTEVTMLLAGWALAQYPSSLMPGVTFTRAAAPEAMMRGLPMGYAVGSLIMVPSLILLVSRSGCGRPVVTGEFDASTGELTAGTSARYE